MSEYINNNRKRLDTLKALIRELHAGGDFDEIKRRFGELVRDVSAIEIARMEQELISEGLPAEEVRRLCDVHVAMFQEGLSGDAAPEMTPGHPVHTFKYENMAASELLNLLDEAVAALPDAQALERTRALGRQLGEIERIYLRKENLLFPYLEKHGMSGPSKVMWGIHDQIRDGLKELWQALDAGDAERIRTLYAPLAEAMRQMFFKEENILYPSALKLLSDAEWLAIKQQSDEIGYCLIRPGDAWQPEVEAAEPPSAPAGYDQAAADQAIRLDTGALTPEQINLILTHLPVDLTFVDETDTVRFFSQTPQRIFVRTEAVIGRQVQNCHPPDSIDRVNRLLDDFKAGKRDTADFWIQMQGRFVHIRYFALRDAEGRYRGTLEVTQDIAPLRALEGERRLLDD